MPKSVRKITLSQSRDIPFNRLVLRRSRRTSRGARFSKVSLCGPSSTRTAVRLACSTCRRADDAIAPSSSS